MICIQSSIQSILLLTSPAGLIKRRCEVVPGCGLFAGLVLRSRLMRMALKISDIGFEVARLDHIKTRSSVIAASAAVE